MRFARHAKKRMKEREITEEEVETTIKNPEYMKQSVKGRTNAFRFVEGRFLRVTFKEGDDNFLVITVTKRKKPFMR